MPEERVCSLCERPDAVVTLKKCPICFKMVCVDCAYRDMGRYFCSRNCSILFFWGEEEE